MSIWSSLHPVVRVDAAEEEGHDNHPDHGQHVIDVAATAMSPHIRLAVWPDEDADTVGRVEGELYLTYNAARLLAINLLQAMRGVIPDDGHDAARINTQARLDAALTAIPEIPARNLQANT